ncbi:DUF1616 domain-containing protein [Salinadaptatus halalkaliphilus]|uniref:DUF1616 domain-containing protein n=1 Tax=Salinadaptatus halalkaliphilus TaxID=2419781 RepID=A0A4S3TK42_9EURY|nr:DUF1616 domain-containing protein [Salinadaptatus halalkaliphilus]THE64441.1 DUF1616 domain-containing protein [Salinadaptatus halalkaliphilus]
MVDARSLWLALPRQIRALPIDLATLLLLVVAVNAAMFAPVFRETQLRIPLGLVFVLFLPGYAFVAALFPESSGETAAEEVPNRSSGLEVDSDDTDAGSFVLARSGIDGVERIALSFGLSVVIVPLIALALNYTPWGIGLLPIVIVTSTFVVLWTIVGVIRRWTVPPEDRFSVPYRAWIESGRTTLLEPDTRTDAVLNVILVASVLLALGAVSFAVAVPPAGEQFSSVYIVTEDDDSELVADAYPTEFEEGDSREIVFGIDNHEHRVVHYTTILAVQDVESEGDELVVLEQDQLDRFDTTLEHDETWHHDHEIEPTMTGEELRVVWLVYLDGDVPDEPTLENAAYAVDLEIEVDG